MASSTTSSLTTIVSPLLAIPPELLLKIFSNLPPTFSTCLGLTCKSLYTIHRSLHSAVPLHSKAYKQSWKGNHYPYTEYKLGFLLREWAAPALYCRINWDDDWEYGVWSFVTWEKTAEVEMERERDEVRERKKARLERRLK